MGYCLNGGSLIDDSIVVVKSAEYIADVEWAFLAIEKNMRQHPARRAVIVFASASDNIYGPTTLVPYPWLSIREIMKSIIDLNGIIVVGAGNRRDGGTRRVVDTLPALFNGPDLPLVVAGSVDNGGILAPFSQGPDHVDTWAPGVEVSCTRPIMAAQMGTGTSYSAGMVSLCFRHPFSGFSLHIAANNLSKQKLTADEPSRLQASPLIS